LQLGRPPSAADAPLATTYAYLCLALVIIPVCVGGKVYTSLQAVMTVKVIVVLGFCLVVGVFLVDPSNWVKVFSGFLRFGSLPTVAESGGEEIRNVFDVFLTEGSWPVVSLASIAMISAFAGYAGGGGLGNALYSNYIRDQGWGMGSKVGAIPSAVGGLERHA
jgi:amino acid transporter